MAIEMTRHGYIQLLAPDGTLISQHQNVEEAIESGSQYAEDNDLEDVSLALEYPSRTMRIRRAVIVQPGDVIPPDAPSQPIVTNRTSVTITLGMPTSSASDHSHYQLWRSDDGGLNFTNIANSILASTYVDGSLQPSTSYQYYLIDVDNSLNESQPGAVTITSTQGTTSDPYDLSGLTNIEWTPVWPAAPDTNQTINVAVNDGLGLASAVATAGARVVVPAGTYNTNLTFASDVDLVMDNAAFVIGAVVIRSVDRLRWTGGNWDGTSVIEKFHCENNSSDILLQDIYMDGRIEQRGNLGFMRRFALVNSTLTGSGFDTYGADFIHFSSGNSTTRYQDFIFANVRMENHSGNAVNRYQYHDRLLFLDCIFNWDRIATPGPAALRIGETSDTVHIENTHIYGRIFTTYNENSNQNVSNARIERSFIYEGEQNVGAWLQHNPPSPPNSGVVNNSQAVDDATGGGMTPGQVFNLGQDITTEDGNPVIIDLATHIANGDNPDINTYGAQR